MSGQVASESDQDWFRFSVTSPHVTVHFDSPKDSGNYGYHTIQVRDGSGIIFASFDVGEDTEFQTGLPSAGTYFIVVRDGPRPELITQQYGVSVSGTAPPAPSVVRMEIFHAIEVVWSSTVGKSYVVERTSDLSSPTWFPLSPSLVGTGAEMTYLASIRGESKGFYRVREQ